MICPHCKETIPYVVCIQRGSLEYNEKSKKWNEVGQAYIGYHCPKCGTKVTLEEVKEASNV